MKKYDNKNLFLVFIFTLGILSSVSSRASVFIPRIIYNSDRKFYPTEKQEAIEIKDSELDFQILLFKTASETCKINNETVVKSMHSILRPNSTLWSVLNSAFSDAHKRLKLKNPIIVLDDFTDFAGASPAINAYSVTAEGHPLIGLNCTQLARLYWMPTLAHEFAHALFENTGVESWWEEGIAQNIEADIGGEQPALTLKHLKSFSDLPDLLEKSRPLPSKQSYALNQLFVRSIKNQFGGWPVLQAMNKSSSSAECETQKDFLTKLACRGRKFLEKTNPDSNFLSADKMTRAGLLRYFWVAFTLNDKFNPRYNIPAWQGVDLTKQLTQKTLKPTQAMAYENSIQLRSMNPNLEYYRVLSDLDGQHVILPGGKIYDEESLKRAQEKLKTVKKDFILILNIGFNPESITPN